MARWLLFRLLVTKRIFCGLQSQRWQRGAQTSALRHHAAILTNVSTARHQCYRQLNTRSSARWPAPGTRFRVKGQLLLQKVPLQREG